jgi:hypothetical protein
MTNTFASSFLYYFKAWYLYDPRWHTGSRGTEIFHRVMKSSCSKLARTELNSTMIYHFSYTNTLIVTTV